MSLSRRMFLQGVLGSVSAGFATTEMSAVGLHCTPAPNFPIPLEMGTWCSQPFPVGKHDNHIELIVDRLGSVEKLDCELGPPRNNRVCNQPPLLDMDWTLWDGASPVQSWPFRPIQPSAWGEKQTSCILGSFKGKRNAHFSIELNIKKDAGHLKELHPRIQITKTPGYWCWL
ncbi:MAG: hypothetical protein JSS87_00010 [Acidobacteria bacterium]|nr:hypothetical protein [Acidobacteriota bacterium]